MGFFGICGAGRNIEEVGGEGIDDFRFHSGENKRVPQGYEHQELRNRT
jgi:hypothetical protein